MPIRYLNVDRHSYSMRLLQLVLFLFLHLATTACTLFKITQDGRTLVGNHEDAWSINARIRFVNGKNGELGAVYFSHYSGSPLRSMGDQGGMNEAGLMFDGFSVPVTELRPQPGKPAADIHALVSQAMRTCETVEEVAEVFRPYSLAWLNGGMLFFGDRNGNYLVVEADTLVTGSDANYALGNFRASQCTDVGAVPIERFQRGRRMLVAGPDTSLAYCTTLLDSMSVCRSKLGEGTLYSYLADLNARELHVFFYHDFTHRITFNLKEELAKGDHELEIARLFPTNAEYERLLTYKTPMHQRWLFWALVLISAIALFSGITSLFRFLRWCVMRLRKRDPGHPLWQPLMTGVASAIILFLVPALLLSEGVFYFGLGDATDRIHPALVYLPMLLCMLAALLVLYSVRARLSRKRSPFARFVQTAHTATVVVLVGWLFYWGLFWP